ncbi:hypothetical protein [Anaerovibrio sp. RM50]|uniref:hypothetical protein n=1 Tax=Anaerovibrio sp. RM50 TaxID=1200557 RepID=UPI00055D9A11|nr:hypothetical protein [Anaerovibrio sp. RM50]
MDVKQEAKKKEFVAGSGRPRLDEGYESKARGIHMIRAYDDEWTEIRRFMGMVRTDVDACRMALDVLEYLGVGNKKIIEKLRKLKEKQNM